MELGIRETNFLTRTNIIGAFPLVQTIIGALRILISSVVAIAALIFGLARLAGEKKHADPFFELKFCIKQLALGFAEIFPVIGTIVHHLLDNRNRKQLDTVKRSFSYPKIEYFELSYYSEKFKIWPFFNYHSVESRFV